MEPEPIRDVLLDDWGRVLLEEVLFRAARAVTERPRTDASIDVSITFRLTADVVGDCLEIRTDGAAEPPLVTRLPRPF